MTPPSAGQRQGQYLDLEFQGESFSAYLPPRLPPAPPVETGNLQGLLDEANQALGRLDGMTAVLPSTPLFLYMYVRKEALLSSQIEGTQSTLSDLLLYESKEAPGAPIDDVQEVSNYVAAMEHGLGRIQAGAPISLDLIQDIHGILMRSGRGEKQAMPGKFRQRQNWIGGPRPSVALFVPPPPERILALMEDLERFINAEDRHTPALVRAGLMHVQFETIHPFLDGNGRLGRLLITFLLCHLGILKHPVLYLSLYLKKNRKFYYDLLQQVRLNGAWEVWLEFFLLGVSETSAQAADTARRIMELVEVDQKKIESLGRAAPSALRVFQHLHKHPIIAVPDAAKRLGVSQPTVRKAVQHMEDLGIMKETSSKRRGHLYSYTAYLEILERGAEPLPL